MGSYKIAYFDGSHRFTDIDFCIRCVAAGVRPGYTENQKAQNFLLAHRLA